MHHKQFNKNIFINCPFDPEYTKLLRPLIFTIVNFGYNPRITLERSDSGKPRLQQLLELIKESKYSIHDLSRLQSIKSREFYRLNMPFELGLAYGARTYNDNLKEKEFLILETKPYDYMKAISDINGLDIKNHNNNPEGIVECLWTWFIETVGLSNVGSHLIIWYSFIDFNTQMFENKFREYRIEYGDERAQDIAKTEIEKLPIPEYIREIKLFLRQPNT